MLELGDRRVGDPSENVGKPRMRIDLIELGTHNQRRHEGVAIGTTVGAGKSHDFLPRAEPRSARSVALFVGRPGSQ